MIIVLDTNAPVQMFGAQSPFRSLQQAILDGRVALAFSTAILLEYEEVMTRYGDRPAVVKHSLLVTQGSMKRFGFRRKWPIALPSVRSSGGRLRRRQQSGRDVLCIEKDCRSP